MLTASQNDNDRRRTCSEEPQDAGADVTKVETVSPEVSKERPENVGAADALGPIDGRTCRDDSLLLHLEFVFEEVRDETRNNTIFSLPELQSPTFFRVTVPIRNDPTNNATMIL